LLRSGAVISAVFTGLPPLLIRSFTGSLPA
jgi:hypothetical protein